MAFSVRRRQWNNADIVYKEVPGGSVVRCFSTK
jgi:hypothetical protein